MENKNRLIDASEITQKLAENAGHILRQQNGNYAIGRARGIMDAVDLIDKMPAVDAMKELCHCCDCYYLLNSKNSLGLYFFCGHQNGLKNIRNTEKDFCPYGKRRYEE